MGANRTIRYQRKLLAARALAAMWLYGASASAADICPTARLLQAPPVALTGAELEQAFWICDYVATTRGMDATPIDTCVAVTDQLKMQRFGGNFDGMLAWWRQNRLAEHGKLASDERM